MENVSRHEEAAAGAGLTTTFDLKKIFGMPQPVLSWTKKNIQIDTRKFKSHGV